MVISSVSPVAVVAVGVVSVLVVLTEDDNDNDKDIDNASLHMFICRVRSEYSVNLAVVG